MPCFSARSRRVPGFSHSVCCPSLYRFAKIVSQGNEGTERLYPGVPPVSYTAPARKYAFRPRAAAPVTAETAVRTERNVIDMSEI